MIAEETVKTLGSKRSEKNIQQKIKYSPRKISLWIDLSSGMKKVVSESTLNRPTNKTDWFDQIDVVWKYEPPTRLAYVIFTSAENKSFHDSGEEGDSMMLLMAILLLKR